MKITLANLLDTSNSTSPIDTGKVLKVGEILNATTVKGGDTSSKVLLRVGQHLLETRTPVPLQNGQQLKLLVKMSAEVSSGKLPLLAIVPPKILSPKALMPGIQASASSAISHSAESKSVAAVKLRQFISAQQSFSQLQQLSHAVLANKKAAEQLPQTLKTWLDKAQNSLVLSSNGVSASQLKQQILNSGILLEAKQFKQLSQPIVKSDIQTPLNSDLKYQLLAIKAELKQINNAIPVNKESQPVTPQQLKQLQNEIVKTGNNTLELSNKLLSLLPASSISKIINLLSQPATPASTTDSIQLLVQLLTKVTGQQAPVSNKQPGLVDQLQLRLMLLELGQHVEQSIHKLNSLQLQPLSREDDKLMLLLFNLVFKDSQQQFDVNFRIEQQDKNSDKDKENWQITLSFNFKTLGNVQSKIFLTGDKVSTAFYTEQPETADKIQQLLPVLQSGLTAAGLHINNISVTTGLPEDKPMLDRGINLLNEIA